MSTDAALAIAKSCAYFKAEIDRFQSEYRAYKREQEIIDSQYERLLEERQRQQP